MALLESRALQDQRSHARACALCEVHSLFHSAACGAVRRPMGWLSWSRFRCYTDCDADPENCLSERLLKTVAEHLVNDGYRDAGCEQAWQLQLGLSSDATSGCRYTAINLDSCWWDSSNPRDASGHLQADPKRFPSGMAALSSYMAERGLQLGTCTLYIV